MTYQRRVLYWYEVESLADVRRFIAQRQPAKQPLYPELAARWKELLDKDEQDLDEYLVLGKNFFWR